MGVRKVTLPVEGMRCASCAAHVERALGSVGSVSAVEVSLPGARATVTLDDEHVEVRDLVDAVSQAGYEIPLGHVVLPIGGMTCVSCAAHVDGALTDVLGVVEVDVNLMAEQASVRYVSGVASLTDFKLAVAHIGYEIRNSPRPPSHGEDSDKGQLHARS